MRKIVGIDIGGTNVRAALADERGRLLHVLYRRTDPKNLIGQIFELVEEFSDYDGIGVSAGGPLDINRGTLLTPPNLDVADMEIVRPIERRFGTKCYLLNDCVAGVMAEKFFGAGRSHRNVVYLTFSTGIGGGVIVDNHLALGKDGNAHEVGHFLFEPDSRVRCGCGAYGHWEAFCGGKNMPKYAKYLLRTLYRGKETRLRGARDLRAEDIFGAKGDRIAVDIARRVCMISAIMVANVVNAYDPEVVSIGGSIMLNNRSLFLDAIGRYSRSYAINRMPKVMATPLGHNVCLLGAVASVLHPDWIRRDSAPSQRA